MTTPDPRTVLRDRIDAAVEHALSIAVDKRVITDAVMSLFADVRPSPWLRAGYVIADIREESTDG